MLYPAEDTEVVLAVENLDLRAWALLGGHDEALVSGEVEGLDGGGVARDHALGLAVNVLFDDLAAGREDQFVVFGNANVGAIKDTESLYLSN